ncbi:MAG: ComF family protein [Alistipes sp.]|nr:ComF family protein [Alistipes sp.]
MSIVGNIFREIISTLSSLIYDDGCMICGKSIDDERHHLCLKCRFEMPTTRFCFRSDNPVKEHFYYMSSVVEASSYIFFRSNDAWRHAIHRLKYNGEWRIGLTLGEMYGTDLKASELYDDVDLIVPVPLHPFKFLKRRYNQSEYIAEGISKTLGVEVDRRVLYRSRNNPSQTRQHVAERWTNVDNLFAVRHPERLHGKHILLVDDVLTTGATIISCIRAINSVAPTCKVSIATIAVAGKIKE